MNPGFSVLFMEPARNFLSGLSQDVRIKILFNIDKSRILHDPKLFKKLNDEIWEFRTNHQGIQFRLLAFWDKSETTKTLVIATHGFIKKTERVTPSELNRASHLRKRYFTHKMNGQ